MYGRLRKKTRPEAQTEPKFIQSDFQGGLNDDFPASAIGANECAVLENLIAFPDGLEGRSGTQLFTATALPGSGTVHSFIFHKGAGKFILHRGGGLWYADNAMAAWTELKVYWDGVTSDIGTGSTVLNGDTGDQLKYLSFGGHSTSNTNNGTLYWNLTNSGSTRTLNVYSDSGKTTLVATGSRVGDGSFILAPSGSSKLYGYCRVVYSGDDTDSGNTITGLLTGYRIFEDQYAADTFVNLASTIEEYGNDAILFTQPYSSTRIYNFICYIDLTLNKVYYTNCLNLDNLGASTTKKDLLLPINDDGTEGAGTPYGYRYVYSFSRIVDKSGVPDLTLDRVTGNLRFETQSTPQFITATGATLFGVSGNNRDYGEIWRSTAISSSSTYALSLLSYTGNTWWNAADPLDTAGLNSVTAPFHYTHMSIYRTLDIGDNGINPENGDGNNQEIYVWVGDIPRNRLTFTDGISDDILRARYDAGFGLRTRFWTSLDSCELGRVSGSFLYTAIRGQVDIKYSQLAKPEYMGFYHPDLQKMKVNEAIQEMKTVSEGVLILCNGKTYFNNPKSYGDQGKVESIFVLRGPQKISDSVGVIDFGSIANIDENAFIAHCSDKTIRTFAGMAWGPDLAANKVSTRIESIVITGSVGAFIGGAYHLWYRTTGSVNTTCLRYGFGGRAGYGWSIVNGADFPFPPLWAGAVVLNDSSSRQRLIVLDNSDGEFHWIETFTNASLARVYKDKVSVAGVGGTNIFPKFRPRELTGETEDHTCYHEESHVYLRPSGSAYLAGFNLTAIAYVDGGSSSTASMKASTSGGDIQYFDRVRGKRIQQEYAFKESGLKVVKTDTHFQVHDTQSVENGPENSVEADYQSELSANMKHWLTREKKLKNRANATDYTMTWADFSFVSSPDGNTYAVPMGAFNESSDTRLFTQADTTLYSDFTVMFWVNQVSGYPTKKIFEMQGTNNFYAILTNSTTLNINGDGNITLTALDGSTWSHIAIVRSGSVVSVYQDKALKGTVTVSGTKGGARFYWNGQRDPGFYLFDGRVYNAAITSSALAFYNDDINSGSGLKTLPIV